MFSKLVTFFRYSRVFPFLVIFRWASLIPAAVTLNYHEGQGVFPPLTVLMLAVFANAVISVFNRQLHQLIMNYPLALGVDLFFCACVLAISGGSHSPYYLYALSPLLAGALFFQVRGAVIVAILFTPLYFTANYSGSVQPSDSVLWMTQLTGIWLIPILFAYPSVLLRDINRGREELSRARDALAQKHENLATTHRQLEIIHDLMMLLQAAPDLISVQKRVLGAVTADLSFSKAIVALFDPVRQELGGWLVYPAEDSFPSMQPLPLRSENGELFKTLLNRNAFTTNNETLVQDAEFNNWLNRRRWFVIPLYLREHPVGILLVDESGLTKERKSTLMTVANQAALALGTTILCIDRARKLAVETERNRIARDIHDTVAQSLFGIVYSLDACINMLPQQADSVRNELIELRSLASSAHDEARRSIFDLWPSALNIELFIADLTNYISNCCRPRPFSIIFNNSGDFNSLSASLKRTIYRMAQEALTNSARHSGAQSARLCLNITEDQVYLGINDEGRGFDLSAVLSDTNTPKHFGLQGIQERARAMSGQCEVISKPEAGARILIELPIN